MAFNLTTEYLALNREIPPAQLPTVESYLYRIGVDDKILSEYASSLDWRPFLLGQISRIGVMAIPFSVLKGLGYPGPPTTYVPLSVLAGVLVTGIGLLALVFTKHKLLTATLLLTGWCWVIPLRTSSGTHEFDALFHIGASLIFFSAILLLAHRILKRDSIIAGLAVAALAVFVISSFQMSRVGQGAEHTRFQEAMTQDFDVIRKLTPEQDIQAVLRSKDNSPVAFAGAAQAVNYYLAQRYNGLKYVSNTLPESGYTLMRERIDTEALLTPENRQMFLYDSAGLLDTYRSTYASIASAQPLIQSNFNVYLHNNALHYIADPCGPTEADAAFFLHILPANENDLPAHRKLYGFDTRALNFLTNGVTFDKKCVITAPLPQYETARIETGQLNGSSGNPTHDSSALIDLYRLAHQAIISRQPIISSNFNVYLNQSALTYIKDQCAPEDTAEKFFLHIYPQDKNILSGYRARYGYENHDFTFQEQSGLLFDGKCMVDILLPQYNIARITTGQFSNNEGRVWRESTSNPTPTQK